MNGARSGRPSQLPKVALASSSDAASAVYIMWHPGDGQQGHWRGWHRVARVAPPACACSYHHYTCLRYAAVCGLLTGSDDCRLRLLATAAPVCVRATVFCNWNNKLFPPFVHSPHGSRLFIHRVHRSPVHRSPFTVSPIHRSPFVSSPLVILRGAGLPVRCVERNYASLPQFGTGYIYKPPPPQHAKSARLRVRTQHVVGGGKAKLGGRKAKRGRQE